MKRITFTLSMVLLIAVFAVEYAASEMITLETLLQETVSLERLAVTPSPAYVTRQFSSYDQRSTDPAVLTDENWFANGDRNQHLRVEENQGREEAVLMDAAGPGAVVRFWSANANDGGIVRVYLDNNEYPALEMPLEVLMGGKTAPFIAPFCGVRGKGWNCYLPIPYKEHCKITLTDADIYHQINYRTYEPGTKVKSFTLAQADELMPLIREKAAVLAEPFKALASREGQTEVYEAYIDAGTSESMEIFGPGAIYQITCAVDADDMEAALRACVITITFDDEKDAVSAPLGDFFGTAPGINAYQALPMGALENGTLYSHWIMPFKESAFITIENHGDADVQIFGEVGVLSREWEKDSLYFHAKWRAEKDIPTRPMQDWNYMTLGGKGRFAGVSLHVANPVGDWWGEGDEKIYVDGETFPSHFGTGTEDYFSYAWCCNELFFNAYHNQIRCDGPGNFGHTCVNRMHIMDDIPFNESFRFDMEIWHWADTKITQAITAYWYAAAGGTDNFVAPPPELLVIPEFEAIKGVEGALEGEELKVVSVTGGTTEKQSGVVSKWSKMSHLWWRGGKPGDVLTLAFPAEKTGNYEVFATFTKAKDYGIHQLSINGKAAGEARDFYNKDAVLVTDEQSLGEFELAEGDNSLEVRILEANPDAEPANMFGLDYLRLETK